MSYDSNNASQSLAESLSADLNQTGQAAQDDTVRELEAFIASVPARTDLYNTKKHFYMGIFCAAILGLLLGVAFVQGQAKGGLTWVLGACVAIGVIMALNHLNAGKKPEATLTHSELTANNMEGALKLYDIVDVEVSRWFQVAIHLDVEEPNQLPKTKTRRGFYPAQAVSQPKHQPPRLSLMLSGVRANGKALDNDQIHDLITDYVNVARAHHQLAAIRAGRPV